MEQSNNQNHGVDATTTEQVYQINNELDDMLYGDEEKKNHNKNNNRINMW